MKRQLISVAILGLFSGTVLAASNITLYGKIDESVLFSHVSNSTGGG